MSPTPGTRLGPYEIGSLLGEGGMGEVYRATDTKLKRDVAIAVKGTSRVDPRDLRSLSRYVEEDSPRSAIVVCNEARRPHSGWDSDPTLG